MTSKPSIPQDLKLGPGWTVLPKNTNHSSNSNLPSAPSVPPGIESSSFAQRITYSKAQLLELYEPSSTADVPRTMATYPGLTSSEPLVPVNVAPDDHIAHVSALADPVALDTSCSPPSGTNQDVPLKSDVEVLVSTDPGPGPGPDPVPPALASALPANPPANSFANGAIANSSAPPLMKKVGQGATSTRDFWAGSVQLAAADRASERRPISLRPRSSLDRSAADRTSTPNVNSDKPPQQAYWHRPTARGGADSDPNWRSGGPVSESISKQFDNSNEAPNTVSGEHSRNKPMTEVAPTAPLSRPGFAREVGSFVRPKNDDLKPTNTRDLTVLSKSSHRDPPTSRADHPDRDRDSRPVNVSDFTRKSPESSFDPQKTWYYRDPQGQVQGPFSASQLLEWQKAGYYDDELPVSRARDQTFKPLAIAFGLRKEEQLPSPPPGFVSGKSALRRDPAVKSIHPSRGPDEHRDGGYGRTTDELAEEVEMMRLKARNERIESAETSRDMFSKNGRSFFDEDVKSLECGKHSALIGPLEDSGDLLEGLAETSNQKGVDETTKYSTTEPDLSSDFSIDLKPAKLESSENQDQSRFAAIMSQCPSEGSKSVDAANDANSFSCGIEGPKKLFPESPSNNVSDFTSTDSQASVESQSKSPDFVDQPPVGTIDNSFLSILGTPTHVQKPTDQAVQSVKSSTAIGHELMSLDPAVAYVRSETMPTFSTSKGTTSSVVFPLASSTPENISRLMELSISRPDRHTPAVDLDKESVPPYSPKNSLIAQSEPAINPTKDTFFSARSVFSEELSSPSQLCSPHSSFQSFAVQQSRIGNKKHESSGIFDPHVETSFDTLTRPRLDARAHQARQYQAQVQAQAKAQVQAQARTQAEAQARAYAAQRAYAQAQARSEAQARAQLVADAQAHAQAQLQAHAIQAQNEVRARLQPHLNTSNDPMWVYQQQLLEFQVRYELAARSHLEATQTAQVARGHATQVTSPREQSKILQGIARSEVLAKEYRLTMDKIRNAAQDVYSRLTQHQQQEAVIRERQQLEQHRLINSHVRIPSQDPIQPHPQLFETQDPSSFTLHDSKGHDPAAELLNDLVVRNNAKSASGNLWDISDGEDEKTVSVVHGVNLVEPSAIPVSFRDVAVADATKSRSNSEVGSKGSNFEDDSIRDNRSGSLSPAKSPPSRGSVATDQPKITETESASGRWEKVGRKAKRGLGSEHSSELKKPTDDTKIVEECRGREESTLREPSVSMNLAGAGKPAGIVCDGGADERDLSGISANGSKTIKSESATGELTRASTSSVSTSKPILAAPAAPWSKAVYAPGTGPVSGPSLREIQRQEELQSKALEKEQKNQTVHGLGGTEAIDGSYTRRGDSLLAGSQPWGGVTDASAKGKTLTLREQMRLEEERKKAAVLATPRDAAYNPSVAVSSATGTKTDWASLVANNRPTPGHTDSSTVWGKNVDENTSFWESVSAAPRNVSVPSSKKGNVVTGQLRNQARIGNVTGAGTSRHDERRGISEKAEPLPSETMINKAAISGAGVKKAGVDKVKGKKKCSQELTNWGIAELQKLTGGTVDRAFFDYLWDMRDHSESEIRDTVLQNLGASDQTRRFADEFIRRLQFEMGFCVADSSGSTVGTVGGRKKGRKQRAKAVDPSLVLGFTATSSSSRIMQGIIEAPEK